MLHVPQLLQTVYSLRTTSHHWATVYSILLEHFVWQSLRCTTSNSLRSQYSTLLKLSKYPNSTPLTLADYNTCLIAFEQYIRTKHLSQPYRVSVLKTFEFIFDIRNTHEREKTQR